MTGDIGSRKIVPSIVPSNDSRRRRGKPAEKTVELATLKTNGVK